MFTLAIDFVSFSWFVVRGACLSETEHAAQADVALPICRAIKKEANSKACGSSLIAYRTFDGLGK
jgi:hypothetical protein